ncbi:MAG: hypothetical protein KDA25_08080, partial [Phycisphaerales bacterium]|nr:hypothetical protein [Phycisphaerales bacterium]
ACGPGSGPCGEPNGTPGCDDVECCQTVCAVDPFCCDTEWDQLCADQAAELCGGGGEACGPGSGSCGEPNGTPGCDDVECCMTVCAVDPFCCDTEWDAICVDEAADLCGGGPVCECPGDIDGDGNVCPADLAALLADWNTGGSGSPCSTDIDGDGNVGPADLAMLLAAWGPCDGGGEACGPGSGPCGEPNGTPGCDDVECCEAVCAVDPFCCDTEWDGICAGEAADLCGGGGEACGPGSGSCGEPNGTPGCDDVECCQTVCAVDPFCCDTEWDQICADEAADLCGGGGGDACGKGAGPCGQANGTPGCDDIACCELICSQDPFCCDTEWDQICADAAIKQCKN